MSRRNFGSNGVKINIYAVYIHLIGENLGFVHFGIGRLDPVKKIFVLK